MLCKVKTVKRLRGAVDFVLFQIDVDNMAKFVAYLAAGSILYGFIGMGFLLTIATLFAVYLALGGWRFMRIVALTLPRDVRYVHRIEYGT